MITHPGARYAGPAWLAAGLVVFVTVRRRRRRGLFEHVSPIGRASVEHRLRAHPRPDEAGRHRRGDGRDGDRAREGSRRRRSRRSRSCAFRGSSSSKATFRKPSPPASTRRSTRPVRSAPTTASRCTPTSCARARSATRSSTRPTRRNADLIVLGSSPRWRRQSRFFSPTVDFVLRHAPCEVLVVAFPDGTFEE